MKELFQTKALFVAVAVIIAAIPGLADMAHFLPVPTGRGYFYGAKILSCFAVFLFLWAIRENLKQLSFSQMKVRFISLLTLSLVSLCAYIYLVQLCIIVHPDRGTAFFPIFLNGPVAEMVHNHGGRYGAIDYYGIAAVEQKIQFVYGWSSYLTVLLFFLLYLTIFSSVVAAFGLLAFSRASSSTAVRSSA